MTEIKISELSIGDWVEIDGAAKKVWYLSKQNEINDTINEYWVKPIPLTPEILEKNGWECIAVGDNGPATPKEHYLRYEKWRCESKWGYRDLFFDRMTKKWRLSGMNCTTFTTVHKLQHALRFSGFEKEIEL